jgi:glucose-6-phosphate isomerase
MPKQPESDYPISLDLDFLTGQVSGPAEIIQRRASDMLSTFYDRQAIQEAIQAGNPLIYEFYNARFITTTSDMAIAITRLFPGKIGNEYYMTKGHQHERSDQPELYICIRGTGYLLLDTLEGEFRAEAWKAGTITHIPAIWAHRVVNTGQESMVYIGVYHASAGHNYALVDERGFAQVVVERQGEPLLVPHP